MYEQQQDCGQYTEGTGKNIRKVIVQSLLVFIFGIAGIFQFAPSLVHSVHGLEGGGSCPLKTDTPYRTPQISTVFVITPSCTKRPIFNPAVYLSHFSDWSSVVFIEQMTLDRIPSDTLNFLPWGPRRTFQNGSLVKVTSDPRVYLLEGDYAYPFESETAFTSLGYAFNQVEDVAAAVLAKYTRKSVTVKGPSDAPASLAFKYPDDPSVYVLVSGEGGTLLKSHVLSMEDLRAIARPDRIAILPRTTVFLDASNTGTPPSASPIIPQPAPVVASSTSSVELITLNLPVGTSTVSGILSLKVTALSNVSVSRVQFLIGNVDIGSVTSSLQAVSVNTVRFVNGSYPLTVIARDAQGRVSILTRMLKIDNFVYSGGGGGGSGGGGGGSPSTPAPVPDTTAPIISSVASSTAATTATITWTTNEAATSTVEYGVTASYGRTSSSRVFVTSHSMVLTGLAQNTLYHFRVGSQDASGNHASSSDVTFRTTDGTIPSVTAFTIPSTSNNRTVSITSFTGTDNIAVTGYLVTESSAIPSSAAAGWVASAPANYVFTSDGSKTLYAWVKDAQGNVSASLNVNVTVDTTAPVISSIASSTAATTATITWTTNEAATSTVEYGATDSYGSTSSSAQSVTSHVVYLTGLTAGTAYHFRVSSQDAYGYQTVSVDDVFQTLAAGATPLVISNVSSSSVGITSATITWTTGEAATSTVEYGVDASYGNASSSSVLATSHSVILTGLSSTTTYHFRVSGQRANGDVETSGDYSFRTADALNSIALTSDPFASVLFAAQDLWGTSDYPSGVHRINRLTGTTTRIQTTQPPMGSFTRQNLAYDGRYVWATSAGETADYVWKIDSLTNAVVATTTLAAPVAHAYSILYDGTSIWVTGEGDWAGGTAYLVQIDPTSSQIVASSTMPIWSAVHAMAFDGTSLWVMGLSNIYKVNRDTLDIEATISTPGNGASDMLFDGTYVWVPKNEALLYKVNPQTDLVVDSMTVGTGTNKGIAFDGRNIWLTDAADDLVYKIDSETDAVVATYAYTDPADIVFDGNDLWLNSQSSLIRLDLSAPTIFAVASSTTDVAATITWETNKASTSTVEYGTTSGYGSTSSSDSLLTRHSVILTGLTANTTYHFRVSSQDVYGTYVTSTDYVFVTAIPDTAPPVISSVASGTTASTATVTWTTNEASTSTIEYGLTTGYGSSSSNGMLTTAHSITVTGLTNDTVYHFKVSSQDASGNHASSTDYTFHTIAADDIAPPVISTVASSTQGYSAIVTWTTDEASTSMVEYGTTTGYGSSSSSQGLVTSHSVALTALVPNTTYHFRVSSQDASGNATSSSDYTLRTGSGIAFDQAATISLTGLQTTSTFTSNGSLIVAGVRASGEAAPTVAWNGNLLTLVDDRTDAWGEHAYLYYIAGAETGTHNLVATIATTTGSPYIQAVSYIGAVEDSAVVDSFSTAAAGNPITLTTTVVDPEAWLVGFAVGGNSTFQAVTGTTLRGTPNAFSVIGDSNGSVGSGGHSLAFDGGTGGQTAGVIMSIKPRDTVAPIISAIASSTSQISATVTWTTNEASTSTVEYGLTDSYGSISSSQILTTSHSITFTGLAESTEYHFRVSSQDAGGNRAVSGDCTLLTTPPDVTAPTISAIASSTTDITALVAWTTNEASTSTVEYGLTASYGSASSSSALLTSHSVALSGLTASTTYHFRVSSQDAWGNQGASGDYTFTTQGADATPPILSSIASSTESTSAIITWTTNESATSTLDFGTTTGYGSSYSLDQFTTSHTFSLVGLDPDTLYHFRISSWDVNGNLVQSEDRTIHTLTSSLLAYSAQGIGGGGAMSSFNMSPYDENLWFVGTDMGQLFRSGDGGRSWRAIDQMQIFYNANLDYASPVGFDADPNVVFFANAGKSPLRSTDKGWTWSAIPVPLGASERIRYWVPNSEDEDVVLCATDARLLKSADKGSTWTVLDVSGAARGTFFDHATGDLYHATPAGVYRSQDDGITFALEIVPTSTPLLAFAGGRDANGLTLTYVDGDGVNAVGPWIQEYIGVVDGATQADYDRSILTSGFVWVKAPGDSSFHRVPYHQTYACITAESDYLYAGADIRLAGQTVYNLPANEYNPGGVFMAENDSQTIYAIGNMYWPRMYGTKTIVSTNAGQTWERRFQVMDADNTWSPWPATNLEWSAVGIEVGWWDDFYNNFSVNQRNSAMAGGTGYFFLHATTDTAMHWISPFTSYADTGEKISGKKWRSTGLEVTSAYRVEFHPTNSQLMYVGMADIAGYLSEDAGNSLRMLDSAANSIYDFAFDPSDDQAVYGAMSGQHDWPTLGWVRGVVGSTGGIYRSANRGSTWTRLTPNTSEYNRAFLSVAYDAGRNIVYGGSHGDGVARSLDGGTTWQWLNDGIPAGQGRIIPSMRTDANGNVYALLTGDFNGTTYTNMAQTGIYFLDVQNGATSWVLLRGTLHLPAGGDSNVAHYWNYPISFAIDPNDSSVLWLIDHEVHWGAGGVWKSTDNGQNWYYQTQYTHPTDIAIDPVNSNNVYVSGEYEMNGGWGEGGLLYTDDGGVTWQRNTRVPYKATASAVALDPNDSTQVWYGFHGAGLLHGPRPDPDMVAPTTPGNISATAVSANSIRISWATSTSDTPVRGYALYREYNDGTYHNSFFTYVGSGATSVLDTGLTTAVSYRYTIRAEDEDGDISAFGQTASIQL